VALAESSNDERLDALTNASARMVADFGTWSIAWGEINRFQRISDDVAQKFDDTKPSLPVGFASAQWGSLAALETQTPAPAKKLYGMRGNSFVAAIEFGPKLKAKAIMAGGQNGDPKSPHFQDQAEMYASGKFRDVLFYPEDVKAHLERQYHPGG
jgi:acyl-homoserine-lactone acylase